MLKPTNRNISKYLKAYEKLKNHKGKELYCTELNQLYQLAKGRIYEMAMYSYEFGYLAGYKSARRKYKKNK